ncbi:MAG: hypothetical protein FI707_03555 [SAR202 cluster bacterium]|nr:hypothetical protein [SAR202 cluster bacterium]MQG57860.1 hypothetical protein [SAR202 cluster bacterium]MQG67849.1 hypothetical protein [SAR202 cluster bacterium]
MKSIALVVPTFALFVGAGCSSGEESAAESAPAADTVPTRKPSVGQNQANATDSATVAPSPTAPSTRPEPAAGPASAGTASPGAQGIAAGEPSPTPQAPSEKPDSDAQKTTAADESAPNASESDPTPAVELKVGQMYSGGTLLTVAELGVTFEVPEGWFGGIPQGAEAMLLRSDSRAGMVVAMGQQSTDVNEVLAAMSAPFPVDNTTLLAPKGTPEVEGEWVRVGYSGTDGVNSLSGFAMAKVDPEGRGIVYLAAGPEAEGEYFQDLVRRLVASTKSAPVVDRAGGASDPAAGVSPLGQQWTQHLSGMLLTFMSTYGSSGGGNVGSTAKRELYMCRNGEFYYTDESLTTVDVQGTGGYSGGQDQGQGQWRIVTQGSAAGLELRWDNGDTTTHLLEFTDNKTYLDEERWFVTADNSYC